MTVAVAPIAEAYRVTLALTWTATDVTRVYVERQDSSGDWTPVRGDDPTDWTRFVVPDEQQPLRQYTGYDYEAPFGEPVRYRARGDGSETLWSNPSPNVQLTSTDGRWVLHPVSHPAARRICYVVSQPALELVASHGEFYALGRADPVITYGTPRSPKGNLVLYADSHAERDQIVRLLSATEPLVVRSPPDNGFPSTYIATGDVHAERVPDLPRTTWDISAPWWNVALPVVPVTSLTQTYGDVALGYADYATIAATVPTYHDLATAG